MGIVALGYLGIRSDQLDNWSDFASGLLGMQQVDRGGQVRAFRMDDRKQRLVVTNEPGDTIAFMGWEVAAKSDLDWFANRLETNGVRVTHGSRSLADKRFVTDLIYFHDPLGNRVELFWGPMVADEPFTPGRPISGFNTGPLGMGHAVLQAKSIDTVLPFYCELLGFNVSDYALKPFPMYFFHVNGRHHSFAVVATGGIGFHHFMVEFNHLDDVGQGFDIAQLEEGRVAYTLGRHTNDYMTSFYANSPSGFFVENGWGGRVIDTETWEPHETFIGPSFWGHDRVCLPDAQREAMRKMSAKLASEGKRAPHVVDCPWLYSQIAK